MHLVVRNQRTYRIMDRRFKNLTKDYLRAHYRSIKFYADKLFFRRFVKSQQRGYGFPNPKPSYALEKAKSGYGSTKIVRTGRMRDRALATVKAIRKGKSVTVTVRSPYYSKYLLLKGYGWMNMSNRDRRDVRRKFRHELKKIRARRR
jgi:hypothetical protein